MAGIEERQLTGGNGAPRQVAPARPDTVPLRIPLSDLDGHGGHAVEPPEKRPDIGPDHILYPVLISIALFPILMGSAGHHVADEMPEDETHPFFPDHFWPYPIIMVAMLVTVGLLAALVRQNMTLEPSADPRQVVLPRPDWYFLFLFQFLKIPILPEWIMALVIPPLVGFVLLIFPFLDATLGPAIARRRGLSRWPVPGRNLLTGGAFVLGIVIILFLEIWSLAGFTLFGISGS